MTATDRTGFVASLGGAWDRRFREERVASGGRHTRALVGGDGPPVVLLHGWPMTSLEWRFVAPALAAGGRRAVAVDLPGLGGSGPASDGYDTVAVASDILTAADALGIGRFALVGHDVGGMVAVSLALAAPERVTALCCVETDVPGIGAWEEARRNPHLWHFGFHGEPGLAETLVRGRERAYLDFFHCRDRRTPGAWDDATLDAYAAAYAAPGRLEAGFAYYRAFGRTAERNRDLAARGPLPMPVLCVGGEASLGAKVAGDLATVSTRVERLVIAGCGHFVPEEAPEVFAPALLHFLDRHDPPG